MRTVAERLAEIGTPAIFDCGLTTKQECDIFANWAADLGLSVALHVVDTPTDTRWQRVQKRNTEQAETFRFNVTREMFDFIESMWEAPDEAEMAALNGVRITR